MAERSVRVDMEEKFEIWLQGQLTALFKVMTAKKLSIDEVAYLGGLSSQTVRKLVKFDTVSPATKTLFKLGQALGVAINVPAKFQKPATKRSRRAA